MAVLYIIKSACVVLACQQFHMGRKVGKGWGVGGGDLEGAHRRAY